jgi:hypothetical protein
LPRSARAAGRRAPSRRQPPAPEVDARQLVNEQALGFAANANKGFAETSAPFVIVREPGHRAAPGRCRLLLKFAETHPRAGVVGPQLLFPDGRQQPSRRRFPTVRTIVRRTPLRVILRPEWHTIDGAKDPGRRARLARLLGVRGEPAVSGEATPSNDDVRAVASALPAHLTGERALRETVSREHSRVLYLGDSVAYSASTSSTRIPRRPVSRRTSHSTGTGNPGSPLSWRARCARGGTVSTWGESRLLHPRHGRCCRPRGPGRARRAHSTPSELLRQTLDVNGFPHVDVVAKAASDSDGETLQLVIPARRSIECQPQR